MYSRESKLPFAVYAYATSVLARGGVVSRMGGGVTRGEAAGLMRALVGKGTAAAFFQGGGDVAGVMHGAAELFFEYDSARGALACGALVYRFRTKPRPGVLAAFFEEAGGAGAGGGALVYREETRALLLSRTYFEAPAGGEFAEDMKRLAGASLNWGAELLERVASRHEQGAGTERPRGV